jgi:hypothetical protein
MVKAADNTHPDNRTTRYRSGKREKSAMKVLK